MNAREWIDAYAERLGVSSPSTEEFTLILDLAAEAAHTSERIAAPIACWVAATAGVPLERALEVARAVSGDD
jgi:DNA-binding transcriptional regulator YdaS (Cro superfamily)